MYDGFIRKLKEALDSLGKNPVKIYLAGPISPNGVNEDEYWSNIRKLVILEHSLPQTILEMGYVAEIRNPATDLLAYFFCPLMVSERYFKERNLISIKLADMVFAVGGWSKSGGAKTEIEYAKSIGKLIFYEEEK